MEQNKLAYIELCQTEESIPLFMHNGWLDAVITEGSSWQVVLAKDKKGQIIGALTFQMKPKWRLMVLTEPHLSPFCGVWFRKIDTPKRSEQYHIVKKILNELIKQLPPFHFAHFRFSTIVTDWQPFYWARFQQTTRYTYQLDLKKTDDLFADFEHHTQRNIRKAESHFQIISTDDFNKFLTINNLTFERQNKKNPIADAIWHRADTFLKKNHLRKLYFAVNTEGGIDAAIYIVFDKKTAYYMAGGTTDRGRKWGATYLLLGKAIQDAQTHGFDIFDFEGSMLQGVESFFRGFNGQLTPYYVVWKYRNRFIGFVDALRNCWS